MFTVGEVANYPTMLCAYEGWQWVKNNKGQYKQAFADVVQRGKDSHNVLKTSGIVLVPGNGFGNNGEGWFRLSIVASEEQMYEVIRRLKEDGFRFE